MRAYQTPYKGIRFRSRLEAKWAWMFDQFGWPWEYEPFELDNYIPDFVIPFAEFGEMIIEIKPVVAHSLPNIDEQCNYSEAIAKMMQSGWHNEYRAEGIGTGPCKPMAILGASVYPARYYRGHLCGIQFDDTMWSCGWRFCTILRCLDCHRIFFYPSGGERSCRWCGSDNKHYMRNEVFDAESYWIGAKNTFQWRKGQ